jgi:ribosomal protein S18 acetylase RimI-like enzyme
MEEDKLIIEPLKKEDSAKAVEIYTEGFSKDPLHLFAFPDEAERIRITKVIYSFMVYELVPLMGLKIIGAYLNDELAGVLIYTPLDSKEWNDEMNKAAVKMQRAAENENVKLIGEFSMEAMKRHPSEPHYYMNELSVSEKYRRRGIGCGLLLDAEKEARLNPLVRFVLLDTTNPKNVNTYRKIGYEVRETYPFHTLTSYSMWKKF